MAGRGTNPFERDNWLATGDIPGSTNLPNAISPFGYEDAFGIIYDGFMIGGYAQCQTLDNRDAIPLGLRKPGMYRYVFETDRVYKLNMSRNFATQDQATQEADLLDNDNWLAIDVLPDTAVPFTFVFSQSQSVAPLIPTTGDTYIVGIDAT